jgi:exodeoxyribonuclease VII large subunit
LWQICAHYAIGGGSRSGEPQSAGAAAPASERQQRLEMAMDYFLANRTRRFTQLHHRLQQQHPQLRLARQQTVLDRLRQRMNFALDNQLKRAVSRQQRRSQRLNQQNPQPKIYRAQTRIQQLEYRLAENLRTAEQHPRALW